MNMDTEDMKKKAERSTVRTGEKMKTMNKDKVEELIDRFQNCLREGIDESRCRSYAEEDGKPMIELYFKGKAFGLLYAELAFRKIVNELQTQK